MNDPLVSVILVNWNTRALTENAVASLQFHERNVPHEIIIVDNASGDGSADHFELTFPEARIIRSPVNEGFARGNNRGVEAARGEYVLLLNTDTIFHEEVLQACLTVLKARGPAILGCRLLNADGTLQLSAERFPRLRDLARDVLATSAASEAKKLAALPHPGSGAAPVDWLCGAFLLMERETYRRLGGLSTEIFMYGEDTEFCWRAKRHGVPSIYMPDVAITHLGGGGAHHGSFRSLVISDAGRLRAFRLMRGSGASLLLRIILMTRSALRFLVWGIPGTLAGDGARVRKALNHGREVLVLAGISGLGRTV